MIPPQQPQEQWYVFDWNDGFQYFDTEKDAIDTFLKILEAYKQEAVGDEWQDEIEHLSWGKINQTVKLKKVMGDIYESVIVTRSTPLPPQAHAPEETRTIEIPADRKWTLSVTDDFGCADIWEKGYTDKESVMIISLRAREEP